MNPTMVTILAKLAALALLGALAYPFATIGRRPAVEAPNASVRAAELAARGYYPFSAHGFDSLLAAAPADGVPGGPRGTGSAYQPNDLR